MDKALGVLYASIVGIHSGTVSAGVVDTVKVPSYGQMTPVKHLAISVKSGNIIQIDPYDPALTHAIAKSLTEAGFNAYAFSKTRVCVNVPPPTGDEKKRIIIHLNKLGEEAKISVRNIRKKYRQSLEKEDQKDQDAEIQKITDAYIQEIDDIIKHKTERL